MHVCLNYEHTDISESMTVCSAAGLHLAYFVAFLRRADNPFAQFLCNCNDTKLSTQSTRHLEGSEGSYIDLSQLTQLLAFVFLNVRCKDI